jgi:hypothetical protein
MHRFNAKYTKLGFNPTNCMLWIGWSSSGEDAWLAWVLNNMMDDNEQDPGAGNGKEDTRLTEKHYRMTVMFLAEMLRQIGHRDIIVMNQYPRLTDDTEYRHATNLM